MRLSLLFLYYSVKTSNDFVDMTDYCIISHGQNTLSVKIATPLDDHSNKQVYTKLFKVIPHENKENKFIYGCIENRRVARYLTV